MIVCVSKLWSYREKLFPIFEEDSTNQQFYEYLALMLCIKIQFINLYDFFYSYLIFKLDLILESHSNICMFFNSCAQNMVNLLV